MTLQKQAFRLAHTILREHGIFGPAKASRRRASRFIKLVNLRTKGADSSSPNPTLFITADWDDNTSPKMWSAAVKKIKCGIDDIIASRLHKKEKRHESRREIEQPQAHRRWHIAVEMLARDLLLPVSLHPLECDGNAATLFESWPLIEEGVFRILSHHNEIESHLRSISSGSQEHHSPTRSSSTKALIVGVSDKFDDLHWPSISREIQQFLDSKEGGGHGFKVHMQHEEEPERAYRPGRLHDPFDEYEIQVGMGAQIGVEGFIGSGTMGCWLELQLKSKNGEWCTVGLTNYHVIERASRRHGDVRRDNSDRSQNMKPEPEPALDKANVEGMRPKDEHQRRIIEQPPRVRVDSDLRVLNGYAAQTREVRVGSLSIEKATFDRMLGTAWAGSGYGRRTRAGYKGDWGLIYPHQAGERIAPNRIPSLQEWREAYPHYSDFMFPIPDVCGQIIGDFVSMRDLVASPMYNEYLTVYKLGAATGMTIGYLNLSHVKSDLLESPNRTGFKVNHVIDVNGGLFCAPGDSGSVVFDRAGRMIAQICSKCLVSSATVVIAIHEIIQDIKDFLGDEVMDVRLPSSRDG